MKISYGKGLYKRSEGGKETTYTGEVILNDVKIYIDGKADSFISLNRIEEIKKRKGKLEMKIVPSVSFTYTALIQGQGTERLLDDLLLLKGFKKVWIGRWKAKDFWKRFR
ncbi:MAG: hypothetical protein U9O41_00895 [Candidatus Aerophobetes bacterium]|nr:hypothetical protein [Candidatus Aerophobetes bacterium]